MPKKKYGLNSKVHIKEENFVKKELRKIRPDWAVSDVTRDSWDALRSINHKKTPGGI